MCSQALSEASRHRLHGYCWLSHPVPLSRLDEVLWLRLSSPMHGTVHRLRKTNTVRTMLHHPVHGAVHRHKPACAWCCAQGSGLSKCTVLRCTHITSGRCPTSGRALSLVANRGERGCVGCSLAAALVSAALCSSAAAACSRTCIPDEHMQPSPRESCVQAHPPPLCPRGIVSAHEQLLQPASMSHWRPSLQCAPLQQLCRRTGSRQACTATCG